MQSQTFSKLAAFGIIAGGYLVYRYLYAKTKVDKGTQVSLVDKVDVGVQVDLDSDIDEYEPGTAMPDGIVPLKHLANGAYGSVSLVKALHSDEIFALKKINRAFMEDRGLEDLVHIEKNAMETLDHPFIIGLKEYWEDQEYHFFLMEAAENGDLFDILSQRKVLSEADARFYAASIILALEHMHSQHIVHRDLKPANIVLDRYGYIRVIDFGAASMHPSDMTTIIGTPSYMAPEVHFGSPYTALVDYWSLGVIIFEMLHGEVPFTGTPAEKRKKSMQRLVLPAEFSEDVKDLLRKLLAPKRQRAKAFKNGLQDIKHHSWFAGFDWDSLLQKTLVPPSVSLVLNKF